MMKIRQGFTLAEVLTTLMVIGVVAAMTIPTLMNSTGDQQAKVAAKKAASVLSQGIQLMIAKEVECQIDSNDANNDLAECINTNVLSGTLDGNTITTNDGIVYSFFAPQKTGSFEAVCGSVYNNWRGGGTCAVIADTNGLAKGTKDSMKSATALPGDGIAANDAMLPNATDRVAFAICANGVRPIAMDGTNTKAYEYMFGKTPTAAELADTLCVKNDAQGTACPKDANTIYGATTTQAQGGCPEGYTAAAAGKTYVDSNGSCPAD